MSTFRAHPTPPWHPPPYCSAEWPRQEAGLLQTFGLTNHINSADKFTINDIKNPYQQGFQSAGGGGCDTSPVPPYAKLGDEAADTNLDYSM